MRSGINVIVKTLVFRVLKCITELEVIKELLNALGLKMELLWNIIFPLLPSAAAVIGVTVETINLSPNLNFDSALLVLLSHCTNANSIQQNVV
jgi:hypothetical protein